jgi:NAD(P)-dependent dehydrogenase (short-subunit alcohol dehydrogenase family)
MSDPSHDRGRLAGRTAVVTGASSGNGRAIALALARDGATVICTDLQPQARQDGFEADLDIDTDEVIRRGGGIAVFRRVDVASEADLQSVTEWTAAEFGRLDVWVNNAGIAISLGDIETQTREDFEKTLSINLTGTWLGCKSAVAQMKRQEIQGRCRGRIINLGSITGDGGQSQLSVYTAAKGGIHAITRQLAIECASLGINVNAVAPGYIPTGMNRMFWDDPEALQHVKDLHPWFELARVEDVAGPVAFLASDDAAFITGVVLPVDGGVLAA